MADSKILKISASKLKTFLSCRWQYYAKYVLKLEDHVGDKARLGSALHEILELLANPKKKNRQKFIDFAHQHANLHPVLLKLLVRICNKYRVKDLLDTGAKLLLSFLCHGFSIKKVVDVERHFSIPVSQNVAINGFIDLVAGVDNITLELSDYKTGQPISPKDCETDIQPLFYLLAGETLYPGKQFLFTFHFLKNCKSYTIRPKTKEQLEQFKKFVIAQAIAMRSLTKDRAKPCKSWKCKCCDFKESRPKDNYTGCPAFAIFKQK